VSNKSDQAERGALAGSTTTTTLHSLTALASPEPGGRFAKANYVAGSEPCVQYPAAAGPWAGGTRVPDEPPLGFSVDAMEPVGTAAEIEASLVLAAAVIPDGGKLAEVAPTLTALSSANAVETPRPVPAAAARIALIKNLEEKRRSVWLSGLVGLKPSTPVRRRRLG
jgi:hypothetical protein